MRWAISRITLAITLSSVFTALPITPDGPPSIIHPKRSVLAQWLFPWEACDCQASSADAQRKPSIDTRPHTNFAWSLSTLMNFT